MARSRFNGHAIAGEAVRRAPWRGDACGHGRGDIRGDVGDVGGGDLVGDLVLAGQPDAEDLRAAAAAGVRTVVNLRVASEDLGVDEEAVVTELGMQYWNLGFKEPESLTDAIFDRCRGLLRDRSNMPMILHCLSANRVGAIWLAHRALDHGVPYEEALAEALDVGLRSEAYTEKARSYIARS